MSSFYYKTRQVLQNEPFLLQNATGVTKWAVYYKTRHNNVTCNTYRFIKRNILLKPLMLRFVTCIDLFTHNCHKNCLPVHPTITREIQNQNWIKVRRSHNALDVVSMPTYVQFRSCVQWASLVSSSQFKPIFPLHCSWKHQKISRASIGVKWVKSNAAIHKKLCFPLRTSSINVTTIWSHSLNHWRNT